MAQKDFHINPATGVWDDNYYANTGKYLEQSSNPNYQFDQLKGMVQSSIDKYQQQIDDYNKKFTEFDAKNPFNFDQVLSEEKTKATQRLDPYYNQTLNDFLTGVNMKRQRGLEDERTLLTELNRDADQFTGKQKENLDYTLEKTGQGFADAGLYDSGERLRAEGRSKADSQDSLSSYLQTTGDRQNQISTNQNRNQQDLNLSEQQQRRDLTTDESYQVNSQALSEAGLRQQNRAFEKGQYTGAAPGVDPNQYQNNLYSLLGT
jgi:hypothetical protein